MQRSEGVKRAVAQLETIDFSGGFVNPRQGSWRGSQQLIPGAFCHLVFLTGALLKEKLRIQMIKLQITNKEGDSRILEFEDFPVRIGRESDSEIVTDDSKTSRRHATFEMEEGQLYLCDKGSSNGSFLNSTRIEREVASQGDKVRVGNTRIMIVAVEGVEEAPLPGAASLPGDESLEPPAPARDEGEEGDDEEEDEVKIKSSDLAASLAKRRRSAMMAPVFVLLLLGLGVYWYLDKQINAEPPVVELSAADIRHGEAVEQVRKFIWESGHAESVTPGFLNRLEDAKNEYGDVEFFQGETSFADLDYGRMKNITFADNSYNQVSIATSNPLVLEHSENSPSLVWTVDCAPKLPFGGRARTVESLVAKNAITTSSNVKRFDMPYVTVEQGPNKDQVDLRWGADVKGTVLMRVRMDNPI